MLNWLRSRAVLRSKADQLYGAVVAQARAPELYIHMGVPDTPEGRYEMIVLHLFCLLERLKGAGAQELKLSRLMIERFVADLDGAMREMGVGDVGVAKKVKAAAAGFYGRAAAYRQAVKLARSGNCSDLENIVLDVVGEDNAGECAVLSDYVLKVSFMLEEQPLDQLIAEGPRFAPGGD